LIEEEDKEEEETGVKSRSFFFLIAFIVGLSFISLSSRSDLRYPREYSNFVSLLTVRI